MLGLLQGEAVETLKRRRVKVMKGRGGEGGEFEVNWDMTRCDFGERDTGPVDEAELAHL